MESVAGTYGRSRLRHPTMRFFPSQMRRPDVCGKMPPMTQHYDCIIIGGGHNGLVCASYLARGGKRVLVLERQGVVGGAAVTDEIAPGYFVSTASYLVSLLLPEIERDLELKRHGYRVLGRNPSSFTPLPDGRHLLMGPDEALNHEQIAKFSACDAEAYPRYEAWLT